MQPTTILIQREADAKVFEVIEQRYPEVRWYSGGEDPTRWKPKVYPYVLIVDSDNDLTWSPLTAVHDITATDWLAQHGYVPDGDGYRPLQVGDTVEALMDYLVHDILILKAGKKYPVLSSEPDYFTIKCEIQKMQWKHSRIHEMFKYVAPVPAPHDNDSLDAMKYAMCGVVKFRTEQREKELTERGYVKEQELVWRHKFADGYVRAVVVAFVHNATDKQWSNFITEHDEDAPQHQPQPAPYTAGQEVDRIFNAETGHTKRVIFDHEHNGIAYVKYPESTYPVGVSLDSIRPVQVQPEVPEWEKKVRDLVYLIQQRVDSPDDLIRYLRPLITPKQVTDEEIEAESNNGDWLNELTKVGFRAGARWMRSMLQKAEGGKG